VYEDLEGAEWISEMDNRLLRAELSETNEHLVRVTAERDVLERVVTTALIAGAGAAVASAARGDVVGGRYRE
jgi:hypothetical protein